MFFVGKPEWTLEQNWEDTLNAIRLVLNRNSPWAAHICCMLSQLDHVENVNLRPHVEPRALRFTTEPIPSGKLQFVFFFQFSFFSTTLHIMKQL